MFPVFASNPLLDLSAEILSGGLAYLLKVLKFTAIQLGVLLGPSFIFGFVMQFVGERLMRNSYHNMGRAGLFLTAPGTALHELSHAGFALLFGHKVLEVKLFEITPEHLGYIRHSFNPNSLFQKIGNFFVGTGPVWGCTLAIFVLSLIFLDSEKIETIFTPYGADTLSWNSLVRYITDAFLGGWKLFANLFSVETLKNPLLWPYLYLTFVAGTGFRLSPPDLQGARHGFASIVFVFAAFNLCTAWLGDFSLSALTLFLNYAHGYCALLAFVFIFCLFLLLISHVVFSLIARFRKPKF